MAATLNSILTEIKKVQSETKKISLQQREANRRLASLEKDMKKVLKCVSTENADFEVNIKSSGGGGKAVIPMAAKS